VALIIEARHRVVGLRCEPRAGDAATGQGFEHRKAAAAHQAMHQGGDEHGLAGARQAGDAEPHGRAKQPLAEFGERARRQTSLFDNVGDDRGHGLGSRPRGWCTIGTMWASRFAGASRLRPDRRQLTAAASLRLSSKAARRM
jgi:hypothetical protein